MLTVFHPDRDEWLSDNHREKDEQASQNYFAWIEEGLYRYVYGLYSML